MALLDAPPTSVALVRLRVGLGDLLCTVPALRALRAHLPRAHIALVTWAEMAPVVERMRSWVDELVAFPGDPGIPERPPDKAAIEPFYAAMRERRWDVALQAYGARTAANAVTTRFGARHTGGFFVPGEWDGDLRTHLPYPVHLHEIHRHLALLEHLGVPPGDPDWSSR
jgi:ADP-heptose:LPS heptosyltransferase